MRESLEFLWPSKQKYLRFSTSFERIIERDSWPKSIETGWQPGLIVSLTCFNRF
jgi:hypothetical protein